MHQLQSLHVLKRLVLQNLLREGNCAMPVVEQELSYYLLTNAFTSVNPPPSGAMQNPAESTVAHRSIDENIPAMAYVWSDEAEQEPAFAALVRNFFSPGYAPQKTIRENAIVFCEVAVSDPYDAKIVHQRVMAVCFGNGRFKLRPTCIQDQFGKTLLLNVSSQSTLQILQKSVPGRRGKTILENLHQLGSVFDFTQLLDVFDVPKIGSKPDALGKRLAVGADHLRIRERLDLADIRETGKALLLAFLSHQGRSPEMQELEHLKLIDDPVTRLTVLSELFTSLKAGDTKELGLLPPPELEPDERMAMKIKSHGASRFGPALDLSHHWDIDNVIVLLNNGCRDARDFDGTHVFVQKPKTDAKGKIEVDAHGNVIWIDQQQHHISKFLSYVSGVHPQSASNPLPFRYILNENRIFQCPASVHDRLATRMKDVSTTAVLPDFCRVKDRNAKKQLDEGAYNKRVGAMPGFRYMDHGSLRPLVNGSRVEFCDLFKDGDLFCVKRGVESDAVIKVCQQAADAALTLEQYANDSRKALKAAGVDPKYDPLDNRNELCFVVSLIAPREQHRVESLGLKARLAIVRAMGEVVSRSYGFRVEFIVDPGLSATA